MLRKLLLIFSCLFLILFSCSLIKINIIEKPVIYQTQKIRRETPIGKLIINKINLDEDLYSINSFNNNVNLHIKVLEDSTLPVEENSIMILAAHSGTGKIAYFEDLDELSLNDNIILIYNNKPYYYRVNNIWEEKKNGYIHVDREEKRQLVLTTCHPKKPKYQLIINCIEKEST